MGNDEENSLEIIHHDLQRLLERQYLSSLDTSLAILVPIATLLLAMLRFYEVFSDAKTINITMIGMFLTLIAPILCNIIGIITNKLILKVFSWASLYIILTNWFFAAIFVNPLISWARTSDMLVFTGVSIALLFFALIIAGFNSMLTTGLISSIRRQVPLREWEIGKYLHRPWNLEIAIFHACVAIGVFIVSGYL